MSVINTNVASLNAQRNLSTSSAGLTTSLQRLSSGLRINSAKDDAAGLAISERMTAQIRGSNQAARNANDGISLAQTAEGDLGSISNNLQRMRELSVQSSNASNSDSDRAALQTEVTALKSEIDRVASNSSFNGVKLLDGTFNAQTFQVGANNTSNDKITVNKIANAQASQLGSAGQSSSATKTSAATTTALVAGDLTLNGQQVGASNVGAAPGQSAASAYSIANAINAVSAASGVTATAQATAVNGGTISTPGAITAANSFSINGVDVGAIANGTTAAGQGANIAAAINKISSQTGVSATADASTGQLKMTAADGRDIQLNMNGVAVDAATAASNKTALAAATGLTFGTQASAAVVGPPAVPAVAAVSQDTHGTVTLSSTSASGIVVGGAAVASAGLTTGVTPATTVSSVSSVSSIDISTAAGAQKALDSIDGALKQINDSRSDLGALQNRFSSVVSGLSTTTENLTASRSRITDTDFAAETANLSRSQILQQAGTAMLAQANQLPNSVMSLLRG
jgi:flagellin